MGLVRGNRRWIAVAVLLLGALAGTIFVVAPLFRAAGSGRTLRGASPDARDPSRDETISGLEASSGPGSPVEGGPSADAALPPFGDRHLPQDRAIRGRVVDATGRPVADAIVAAVLRETQERPYRHVEASRVRSEGDGTFVLGPLERRTYAVHALKADVGVGWTTGQMPGAFVEVLLSPGARLTGTVVRRADQGPVAGARVVVRDDAFYAETTTDAQGGYAFDLLPPTMQAWDPPALIVVADGFQRAERTNLILRSGQEQRVDFALVPGATLRGKVVDARSRRPLPGAVVGEGWEPYHRTTRAAADGSYELPNVEVSPNAEFTVRAEGYLPQQRQSDGAGTLDFELDAALVLRGRVLAPGGGPAAGARVYLHRIRYAPGFEPASRENRQIFTTADTDGRFAFDAVLPGQVAVIAFDRAHAPGEQGPVDVPVGGPAPPGVDVSLRHGVSVAGEVRDQQDRPLPAIRVQLQRGWGRMEGYQWTYRYFWGEMPLAYTDEKGRFALDGAIPGQLWLSAWHPTYGWAGSSIQGTEGERITDVVISFAGASISGSVVTADGEPVPGASVYARGPKSGGDRRRRWTSTDGLGRFKLGGLEEGLYDVSVSTAFGQADPALDVPAGSATVELRLRATQMLTGEVVSARTGRALERFTLILVSQQGAGRSPRGRGLSWQGEIRTPDGRFERPVLAGTYTVTVTAPEHAPRIVSDVVVEERVAPLPLFLTLDGGGSICGTLSGVDGKPVPNGWVSATIYRAPGEAREASDRLVSANDRTDVQGRFFLEGLAPGTYLVQSNRGQEGAVAALVTVAGAEAVRQDLRLMPTGHVVFRAVDEEGKPVPSIFFQLFDPAGGRFIGWVPATNEQGIARSGPLPMGSARVTGWDTGRTYEMDDLEVQVLSGKTVEVEVKMRKREGAED